VLSWAVSLETVTELLVLWDVDYTLVAADGLGTRLYEVVFAEMFGRELTAVAPKAGRTDRAIVGDTLALSGIPVSEVGPFLASLTRAAEAGGVPGAVRPLPGAAGAIAALAAAGIRQSVLTGNIRPMAALKLARAGLRDHLDLDAGAYGDTHEVRSELVTAARRAAGQVYGADFPGTATVLVGDTPLDVEAALATGARVVAVATGSYSAAELASAGAHVVLPDLADAGRVLAAVTGELTARCRVWPAGASALPAPGLRRGDGASTAAGKVSPDRAAGRARPGRPVPAMVTEHAGDLGGGRAGTPGNRRPVIPQRLLAVRGGGVVPGLVLPPVLGRVRQPPVELHYYSVLLVHAVPPAAPPVRCRERNLPARLGQSVRPLHVPVIAVLQHRMIARNGRLEDLVQVSAPAQPPVLGHGRLQPGLVGKVPRDRPRHPPAHIVKAPRRLRQVQHRLLHRRPRRKVPVRHRLDDPG
jgi:phosphoglycolate phosphatase